MIDGWYAHQAHVGKPASDCGKLSDIIGMLRRYDRHGHRMNRLKTYVFNWREKTVEYIHCNVSQERRTENEGQSSIEALLQQNQELLKQNAELIEEINRLLEKGKRRNSKEERPGLDDDQEFLMGL